MPYIGNPAVVGDSSNTFRLLDDIASFTVTFDATDSGVVSIANNTLTFNNHRFVTGQKVTYNDGGGTAIGGLSDGSYFIIKEDQNTIKLASSASNAASGTAIDLTSGAAGGSHTLNIAFDGVNTKFKATFNNGTKAKISRAAQLSLSINGVLQQPQDTTSPTVGYGIEADSTIVFSTAPESSDVVFGSFIGEVAASFDLADNTVDEFTADGSTTAFTLSKELPSNNDALVTLDGVVQYPNTQSGTRAYSTIDNTITFTSAPAAGVIIQVRHIGFAGAASNEVTAFYGRTGNVQLKNTDNVDVNNLTAAGGGTFTGNLTAADGTFSGNVTIGGTLGIGGTLTYEDVTNVDAVGLITARDGIVVGSGITLSVDGDGFFTGVITATSYSGIDLSDVTGATGDFSIADKIVHTGDTDTAIRFSAADTVSIETAGNEQIKFNHTTGTVLSNHIVPNNDGTKDIGLTGTRFRAAYVDNYYGSGANLTGINADVVDDTSPQLGGDLDTNTKNIKFGDSASAGASGDDTLIFGADDDMRMYHNGTDAFISNNTGAFVIQDSHAGANAIIVRKGAEVELMHNNSQKFETTSYGTHVTGYQTSSSFVGFHVVGTLSDHGFGTNHGSGITNFDIDYYSPIPMFGSKTIQSGSSYLTFPSYASGNYVKFTAPVSGLYQLELMASVETHHGGDWCAFGWELNTTTVSNDGNLADNGLGILAVYERAGGDEGMGCHFSTTRFMAANDYAILYQQSTAAVRWKGNQYYVRGHLIH